MQKHEDTKENEMHEKNQKTEWVMDSPVASAAGLTQQKQEDRKKHEMHEKNT